MREIPYYDDYLSDALLAHLQGQGRPVSGIPDLLEVGVGGGLENQEALRFLCELYDGVKSELNKVLEQRKIDRKFIDERTRAMSQFNQVYKRELNDPDYQTVIGLEDAHGRVVVGPLRGNFAKADQTQSVAPIPAFLQGPHVTLFGPPDSAKLAVNAMNAYHRKLPGEPSIVGELLKTHKSVPKWGADDEDSKTPLREDLAAAGANLTACLEGTIHVKEGAKEYKLAQDHLALPIKRFPGLALPSFFLFLRGQPLPLHLYDFALHFYHNWHNQEALVFYVPKLENEEEARYVHFMLRTAESLLQKRHPSYQLGSIRLMIVLENPRAILRTHEIMDELHPYFAGASLGWHDYLASTARLFKEDGNYRIPVKADPDIVIKYIKASHELLAQVVGGRGGIKVGGMYGILPADNDLKGPSFQITLKGYIKDVITQMKRDLTGFWVAHPDFVRLGLALVEAWKFREQGDGKPLEALVKALLDESAHQEVLGFINGPDIAGMSVDDPLYVRSLLVADIKESTFIPNNHPDEIRYNVFQTLQYLADWLSGNGCVALSAQVNGVPVRVMDDLATAERSRWEVWHELRHQRFSITDFLRVCHEEYQFIRKDLSDDKKIVQVKWDGRTEKWYPVAFKLMLRLMTDVQPAEFATELLLPFTADSFRAADDPWEYAHAVDPIKFRSEAYVERFNYFFERCGAQAFATTLAQLPFLDLNAVESLIKRFSKNEIIEAASFHGDIGGAAKTLDKMAAGEQALVLQESSDVSKELRCWGEKYREKFGMKFLISAKDRKGVELLDALKKRVENTLEQEIENAREALWQITRKRIESAPIDSFQSAIEKLRLRHGVKASQLSICAPFPQMMAFGTTQDHWLQLASLSKTIASAFALEVFQAQGISLETPVNQLVAGLVRGDGSDQVTLRHLMNHTALNMHYVKGVPAEGPMPGIEDWLNNVTVANSPGTAFQYSGGGFLVLEKLLNQLSGKSTEEMIRPFLDALGMYDVSFNAPKPSQVPESFLRFPAFAAGAMGTAISFHYLLAHLTRAYNDTAGSGPLSHDTACEMLHGTDLGCRHFMGCDIGLGVFVIEAGENRLMIHQGANDGYRALYIHCFAGPDVGKGLVSLSTGDLNGVLYNAEVAQLVLRSLGISGIDFNRFKMGFQAEGLKQEEVVNIGYRDLVFQAFLPMLPEKIAPDGPMDPLASFNLAVGAKILEVTNQRFARAENLLSPRLPVFDPELFGRQGKIMDSWESVRHNPLTHDSLEFELKTPSTLRYVSFSTRFHLGNQPESVRLLAAEQLGEWQEIVPQTQLEGHALKQIAVPMSQQKYRFIRVEMYPDGGLSRLGLYADLPANEKRRFLPVADASSVVFPDKVPTPLKPMALPYRADRYEVERNLSKLRPGQEWDAASAAYGAALVSASNEHYGPAAQLISPFPSLNMFDGLESARSRRPGHKEEVVVELGRPVKIHRVEMDFTYFVNNNPLELRLEARTAGEWVELMGRRRVKAFAGNRKTFEVNDQRLFDQVRIQVFPDGGMNRLHVYTRS